MYRQYLKDPLLWVSIALAAVGGIQTNSGQLTDLAQKHPTAFGLAMMLVSTATLVLTVLKTFLMNLPKEPPK